MDGQRDGQRLVDGRGEAARKVPLALLLSKRVCVECSVSRSGSASVCKLSRCQHGRVYLVTVRHTLKHRSALVGPAGLESRAWLVCHIANALRRSGRDEAREGANMTRSFGVGDWDDLLCVSLSVSSGAISAPSFECCRHCCRLCNGLRAGALSHHSSHHFIPLSPCRLLCVPRCSRSKSTVTAPFTISFPFSTARLCTVMLDFALDGPVRMH